MRGTPDELSEFAALSARVAVKQATPEELERWRALRGRLAPAPPAPPKGQPARAHARAARKLRFEYAPVKEMTVSFGEEVSAGGLRFVAHQHLEPGTPLVVRLELAGPGDPAPLVAAARIAWSRREGNHFLSGVELLGLEPGEKERIEAWAQRKPDGP